MIIAININKLTKYLKYILNLLKKKYLTKIYEKFPIINLIKKN